MWCRGISCVPLLLALQKPQDLTSSFRQVYETLARRGDESYQLSATVRVDKVSHGDKTRTKKPIAVYLPGLDGYGISAATFQFEDLSRTFDFYRVFIDPSDRSSFREVSSAISQFLVELSTNNSQPVTLIGESCGGLFAASSAVKLRNTQVLNGLVMVNPATSFDRTSWDVIAPQLALLDQITEGDKRSVSTLTDEDFMTTATSLPSPYAVLGSVVLSTTIPDNQQLGRILNAISSTQGVPADFWETIIAAFKETEARLPAQLLKHRIQWLLVGAETVNARIKQIDVPTLVLIGQQDRLLPSSLEADRLINAIPKAEKRIVSQRGHFVLDESVNLTEAILYSAIDPLKWSKKKYDIITQWQLPDKATIDRVKSTRLQPLYTAHSPVWFSTDQRGKRWKGLQKIATTIDFREFKAGATRNPILVVANHQLAGLDLGMILTELHEQCGLWLRGLAHPVTFFGNQDSLAELNGRQPGLLDSPSQDADPRFSFQMFGAVPVTPRNYYRLLQTGQDALLFPGGAKEAQSGRKDYPLFWPEKLDFVRTAAKFNATVLPLSAIGMVESVNVLAEPQQVATIPFLGDQLRSFNANITSARYDEKNEDEVIGFPIAVPSLPQRNYFLFGKPISLENIDPSDRDACEEVYRSVKDAVRGGIDDMLRAREADAYRNTPRRLAYEQVFKKQAPTFPVKRLNYDEI